MLQLLICHAGSTFFFQTADKAYFLICAWSQSESDLQTTTCFSPRSIGTIPKSCPGNLLRLEFYFSNTSSITICVIAALTSCIGTLSGFSIILFVTSAPPIPYIIKHTRNPYRPPEPRLHQYQTHSLVILLRRKSSFAREVMT